MKFKRVIALDWASIYQKLTLVEIQDSQDDVGQGRFPYKAVDVRV